MRKHLIRRPAVPALTGDPFLRNFERLFSDDFFRPFGFVGRPNDDLGQTGWLPAVDVRESNEQFVFTAELPGLSKEQVEITVEDGILTLSSAAASRP